MTIRKSLAKGTLIQRLRARQVQTLSRERGMDEHERELDTFFEKIYFYELDSREKVAQRLQMPLVAFLALTGFIGTMLQNVRREKYFLGDWYFWFPVFISVICLIGTFFYFVRSVMGKKYKYHPLPKDWLEFHGNCKKEFAEFDYSSLLITASIKQRIVESHVACASLNGEVNAEKFSFLFNLFRWLLAAALFTIVAFFSYYFGNLDKNNAPSGEMQVDVTLNAKGNQVSQKPPPPPPAPPLREIREDRPRPAPIPKPPVPQR